MTESETSKTAMQIASTLATDIYKDGLQPTVKSIGEALAGIFKAIGHYPRYWGMVSEISLEHKQEDFKKRLEKKFSEIPESDRTLPRPNIVGPTIQALEYAIFDDEIAELFANLLASSGNAKSEVHPAFVEVIKNLSPQDAQFLVILYPLYFRESGGILSPRETFSAVKLNVILDRRAKAGFSFEEPLDFANGLFWVQRGASGYELGGQYLSAAEGWIINSSLLIDGVFVTFDNLVRLGILEYSSIKGTVEEARLKNYFEKMNEEMAFSDEDETQPKVKDEHSRSLELVSGQSLKLTSFGYKFFQCCVKGATKNA